MNATLAKIAKGSISGFFAIIAGFWTSRLNVDRDSEGSE